jgi:HAD superfamily hydrolase (TIGR01549 family)
VLIWDLDGTLHFSPEAANLMKQVFINIVSKEKKIPFLKAIKLFDDASETLTWSKRVRKITGLKEGDILKKLEKNLDRSAFVKREPKLENLFQKLNKFRHIILTNANHKNTISTLELLGFAKTGKSNFKPFENIFSLDNTKGFKPQKKVFKQILLYTQLPPESHLMIGDSWSVDIQPAKKLNLKTCLVGNYHPGADYFVRSVYEVPNIFSLNNKLMRYLKSKSFSFGNKT